MDELKQARLAAGLSQHGMAELMKIPWRTISSWETGNRVPPEYVKILVIAELKRIAERNQKDAE